MRSIILASVLFSGLTAAALADQPKYSRVYKACMDASGSVTMNMRDCLTNEIKGWDDRLGRAFGTVTGKLGSDQRKNLIAARRAWRRYRQTSCAYYASETGGSIDRITSLTCWLELTAHRALEMERLVKQHVEKI